MATRAHLESNHIDHVNTTDSCLRINSFTSSESNLSVEKIGDHLIEEIKKTKPIRPLLPALDLVEKRSVTHVTSPSGRDLFQIIGASGTPYTCFPNLKYCSCPAYHYSVLCKEDYIMCKHVLALKLSEAMGLTKTLQVSNAEITNMIMVIE